MGPAQPIVSGHYVSRDQQNETAFVGMWLFLVQEIMFFGGLFVAYGVYRYKYPITWYEGSAHLQFGWGTLNTVVLLISSVTMATTVWATQVGRWRTQITMLSSTIVLGIVFLGVKWIEYSAKWDHGLIPGIRWNPDVLSFTDPARAQLYFILYFIMTGMHALHMIIGIGIAMVFLVLCLRKEYGPNKYLPVELFGFYWHFVDIVWVFLYPMLYLISSPAGHH
jgi:cytochrome c oxidase subunit 3